MRPFVNILGEFPSTFVDLVSKGVKPDAGAVELRLFEAFPFLTQGACSCLQTQCGTQKENMNVVGKKHEIRNSGGGGGNNCSVVFTLSNSNLGCVST